VYGLLIGPGACLLGVLPASALISNWITKGRGNALGIINLPIFLLLAPVITARLVSMFDMTVVFLSLSVVLAICAILMSRVVDTPFRDSTKADGVASVTARSAAIASRDVLNSRSFWLLSLGVGVVAGGGTALTAHLVPLAMARGFSLESGAWLMSAYATAGIGGVLIFGWIADRFGYRTGLVLNGGTQIFFWCILMFAGSFPLLLLSAIAIGLCTTAILVLHGAAIAAIFGPQNMGSVLGLSYLPKLPFIFGASPLMGVLFDATGGYEAALLIQIGMLGAVIVGFILLPGSSNERPGKQHAT
jgi:cyanate permease